MVGVGIPRVLVIEAVARGNLFRFRTALVSLTVLLAIGTTVAGLTVFFGRQTTVDISFFALAFVLLVSNLRELIRG